MEYPTDYRASFWRRLAAFWIDTVLVGWVSRAVVTAFQFVIHSAVAQEGTGPELSNALSVGFDLAFQLTLAIAYFGVLQAYWGMTLGKRLLGLRVLTHDLQALDWQTGVKRYVYFSLSSLPLYLGPLSASWHPEGRGWHDLWSGTRVVSEPAWQAHLAAQRQQAQDVQGWSVVSLRDVSPGASEAARPESGDGDSGSQAA